MDKDLIKEKIENFKDLRRIFWTVIIVLGGGMAGVIFSIHNITNLNILGLIKLIIFSVGAFFFILFISFMSNCNKEIGKLLKLMEKEK